MRASLSPLGLVALSLCSFALVGCGSDESQPQPADAWSLQGTVIASDIPDGADLAVIWSVDTIEYTFGRGKVEAGRFRVEISGDPPEGAQFVPGQLAIGSVAVLEPGEQLSDGPVDKAAGAPITRRAEQAIIWRGSGEVPQALQWANDFPEGYSCGDCIDVPDKKSRFAVGFCEEMVISDESLVCNFN